MNRYIAEGCFFGSGVSVLILCIFIAQAKKLAAMRIAIGTVRSKDGDVMSYIVTYLLPFVAVKLDDPKDVASLGVLLFVVGLLYVNSNMIYTNPVLNIAGYHVFEVEDSDGKVSALICRRSYVRKNSELDVISIGDYVLLEKT